jgi:hypothetical protein
MMGIGQIDWAAVAASPDGYDLVAGMDGMSAAPVNASLLDLLSASLYAAVRDAFPINGVPRNVVEALERMQTASESMQESIRSIGMDIAGIYTEQGLDGRGLPRSPDVPDASEAPPDTEEHVDESGIEHMQRIIDEATAASTHRPQPSERRETWRPPGAR